MKMKRMIIMIICIILCILMILSAIYVPHVHAEEVPKEEAQTPAANVFDVYKNGFYDGDVIMAIYKDFQASHKDRAGGTEGEKNAAEYLANTLADIGLAPYVGDSLIDGFSIYAEDELSSGSLVYSQNVVGVIKSSVQTDKQVIIGAHYDNVYGLLETLSEGAYDNGSGVATLLSLAVGLKNADLPFNVVIAFFGMEEYGLYGSKELLLGMSDSQKENTLMMINLDSISCGDNLYLYTDEVPRTHEDTFFDKASSVGLALSKMPDDKKANGFFIGSDSKLYYHEGLASDHSSFSDEGILVANFLGYNFSSKDSIFGKEKDGAEDIMHTSNDTLEKVLEIYGEDNVKARLSKVCATITAVLADDGFISVCEHSYANPTTIPFLYTSYFNLIVVSVLCIAFVIAVLLMARKENKNMPRLVRVELVRKKEDKKDPPPDVFDL